MNSKTSQSSEYSRESKSVGADVSLQLGVKTIKTVRLKNFAMERLPERLALRMLLLTEKDEISVNDFLSRVPVWLVLLKQGERECY